MKSPQAAGLFLSQTKIRWFGVDPVPNKVGFIPIPPRRPTANRAMGRSLCRLPGKRDGSCSSPPLANEAATRRCWPIVEMLSYKSSGFWPRVGMSQTKFWSFHIETGKYLEAQRHETIQRHVSRWCCNYMSSVQNLCGSFAFAGEKEFPEWIVIIPDILDRFGEYNPI